MVFGKIKDFVELSELRARAQVDANQAQDGAIDDSQKSFYRRVRGGVASLHCQIDRDVQDPGPFREIHAKEKNVTPGTVSQVHAHGGLLVQHGQDATGWARQLWAHSQRDFVG